MVVCRFFLGFVGMLFLVALDAVKDTNFPTEAAFIPGATYYLSRWYTRKELGFRIAV